VTTFSELGLDARLLQALEAEGYTTPTPIQAQAIPSVMAGKDLLGIAQTGTGKTAAFALPILHRLLGSRTTAKRGGARVLVLSPTRELASQIAESFDTYGRNTGLVSGVVYGGVAHRPQASMLRRGLDILVATPGRLLDHVSERNIDLSQTEILVLDEADQMLDLGFIRPLRQIISRLPAERQGLFFSATMPHEIGALAAELLRDPVKVAVTPVAKTADRVTQRVIHVEAQRKRAMLVELFADEALNRVLVFTRTKRGADKVARHLEGSGIPVAAIHGNKSQAQREKALDAFKQSGIRALVATDIAARGIDVDMVSHVINFELPNIPESYVHRIGRTARAGAEGIAISLCDGEERAYLRDIERLTRQQIPSEDRRGCSKLATLAALEPKTTRHAADEDRGERRFGGDNGSFRQGRPHGKGDRRDRGAFARDDRRPPHRDAQTRDRDRERPAGETGFDPLAPREAKRDHHGRTASARPPARGEHRDRDGTQGDRRNLNRDRHTRDQDRNEGPVAHRSSDPAAKSHGKSHAGGRPHGKPHGKPHGRPYEDRPRDGGRQAHSNPRTERQGAPAAGLDGVAFLQAGSHRAEAGAKDGRPAHRNANHKRPAQHGGPGGRHGRSDRPAHGNGPVRAPGGRREQRH